MNFASHLRRKKKKKKTFTYLGDIHLIWLEGAEHLHEHILHVSQIAWELLILNCSSYTDCKSQELHFAMSSNSIIYMARGSHSHRCCSHSCDPVKNFWLSFCCLTTWAHCKRDLDRFTVHTWPHYVQYAHAKRKHLDRCYRVWKLSLTAWPTPTT